MQPEPRKLYEFHTAGKTFRCILYDIRRGAAQDEKAGPVPGTIDQDPENLEQTGHLLDLIQNDGAFERSEHELRILQTHQIRLGFEIKVDGVPTFSKHPREGRFPALPRPKKSRDGRTLHRV